MKAEDVPDLLDPGAHGGVHDVEPPVPAAALARVAVRHGYVVFRLDCSKLVDKKGFLDAATQTFGLPPWFGRNWDAFRECLTTMEWRPGNGYVVVLLGTEQFEKKAPDDVRILREVFRDAAADWGRRRRPFHVLWVAKRI